MAELLRLCYIEIFTSSMHVNQAKITLLVFFPGFIVVAYLHVSVVKIQMLRKYMVLHLPISILLPLLKKSFCVVM